MFQYVHQNLNFYNYFSYSVIVVIIIIIIVIVSWPLRRRPQRVPGAHGDALSRRERPGGGGGEGRRGSGADRWPPRPDSLTIQLTINQPTNQLTGAGGP